MKVSIIIPCFNEEKYIGNCLESLAKQSYPIDEVVICDNNSTDHSINIIKQYTKVLPIRIVREIKKGIIPALQKAYLHSHGDYILRTDADTVVPQDWVKNIVSSFEKNSNLDVIGGYSYPIESFIFSKQITRFVYLIYDLYFRIFQRTVLLFGCNTAFKRSALKKVNGYTSEYEAPEDIMMCFKMRDHGLKTKRIKECFNFASIRRIKNEPKEVLYLFLGMTGNPKYYHEKSI